MKVWEEWKYKNITFTLLGLIFAAFLARYDPFHEALLHLGNFGYVGAFVAGALFVSTFTVGTGVVLL